MNDLGQRFECKRCRKHNALTHETWRSADGTPVEPTWQYELEELIYLALKQNARAPVLALRRIKANSRDFLYAPEMQMKQGSKTMEFDLWAIDDGLVVVGEAKTTSKIGTVTGEKTAIARLKGLAISLNADRVVVATTEMWTDETKSELAKAFPKGERPELLSWESLT